MQAHNAPDPAAASSAEPEQAGHDAPMFGTLLASRPQRKLGGAANSFIGSLLVHGAIIAGLAIATMAVGEELVPEEEVTLFELPPETPPPPPPPPPPQVDVPAPPVEIAKGFMTLSIPDIVPPEIPPPNLGVRISEADFSGVGKEGGRADGKEGAPPQTDLSLAPAFTPMTVRPELLNVAEVQRALVRSYPPLLRDAGIGGKPVVWFFIDESGAVVKTQISRPSGYPALDDAAISVAKVMKFSPALNRDQKVPVWVEIPIVFSVN